jgi:uncharacterized protein YjbI with pentapeptide repeats
MIGRRDEFEPPKYLASLIAAVNDDAKAAQAGALLFALVGIYLVATAFSASDEDLLRGRTVIISQIGTSLPISFSFAIAPFVFVFLHLHTLARYDMLAANIRQFLADLNRNVILEADRERCRQLLTNVDFVQALVAPPTSYLYSWAWRWLARMMIVIFPIAVLLLVQINALRYQSVVITTVQQFALFIDLLALFWFFYRNSLKKFAGQNKSKYRSIPRWRGLLWLLAVMSLNFYYLDVVPADADPDFVRYQPQPFWGNLAAPEKVQLYDTIILEYFNRMLHQPLDLVLCPWLRWGCRYLRVDHRLLVDHVWDPKAIVELQGGGAKTEAARERALASLEGLVLRDRSLRFATLDESALLAADFRGADLTSASLRNAALLKVTASPVELAHANLIEANLGGADLEGANLSFAHLEGATLVGAHLQGTNLQSANLNGANLSGADLQDADLSLAIMDAADLSRADLGGARLFKAQLRYADLRYARLQGANLASANLQAANLSSAQLDAANLSGAQLQGADMRSAQLPGTDLRGALFYETSLGQVEKQNTTNLALSDLRGADYAKRPSDKEMDALWALLFSMPGGNRKDQAIEKYDRLKAANGSVPELRFSADRKQQVLVKDPTDPILRNLPRGWLIASPTERLWRNIQVPSTRA